MNTVDKCPEHPWDKAHVAHSLKTVVAIRIDKTARTEEQPSPLETVRQSGTRLPGRNTRGATAGLSITTSRRRNAISIARTTPMYQIKKFTSTSEHKHETLSEDSKPLRVILSVVSGRKTTPEQQIKSH